MKYYVERNGYLTELLLSNDNPQTEKELIQRAQAMMAAGVVSISCIQEKQNYYQDKGFERVIFVERKPEFACDYFGFDYEKAGEELAKQVLEKENGTPLQSVIYENDGIKNWADIEIGNKVAKNINILTLESPEANIMKGLAKIYTEKTGIAVNVSIFSYDEIYEQFLLAETFDKYDVLRILEGFMEDSYVEGKIYSIPFQRSTEIVYYNKDAFREVGLDPERPPKTWDELVEYGKKLTNDKRYGVGIALNFDRRCGKHLLQRRFF